MSARAISHYLAEHQRFRHGLAADCLAQPRAAALDYLSSMGFPTRKQERWKYTDVSPITRRQFRLAGAASDAVDSARVDKLRLTQTDCHELVFIDGAFSARRSRVGELPPGLIAGSLKSLRANGAAAARALLDNARQELTHAFSALNLAFLDDGAFIDVPDGVTVRRPIHLIYLSGANGDETMSHPHNIVTLGRDSSATIIETYSGIPEAAYLTNGVTRIVGRAGARLDYYRIQQESRNAFHVGNTRIIQQADSRIDCHALSAGASLARCDIDVELDEPGAQVRLNGLYLTNQRQHADNHTLVEHKQPHTHSDENYRGVMDGHSRAVFNGKVIVHEQAQQTRASQSNANLLLSRYAEVDTKPELEIYADDVRCSHGATVGRLDEDMLFYLRSRAIDEATAGSLLTYAFADEVIRDIRVPEIRARLEHGIAGELPDTELIRAFMQ